MAEAKNTDAYNEYKAFFEKSWYTFHLTQRLNINRVHSGYLQTGTWQTMKKANIKYCMWCFIIRACTVCKDKNKSSMSQN